MTGLGPTMSNDRKELRVTAKVLPKESNEIWIFGGSLSQRTMLVMSLREKVERERVKIAIGL
jgi:hypothetical protein